MKSPTFCAIINLSDYDTWKGAFFMGRKNPAKNINIGLLAHVDAGKTTLSEALLYATGQIRALGRVDHQDAFLDTDAQERARGITIFSKQARLRLNSEPSISITILDTPGHVDFSAEMERTLQVLDYAILVISGTDGVQGHTRTLWRLLRHYHIPTFLFVNKMDLPGADKEVVQQQLKTELSDGCVDFTKDSGEAFFEEAAMGSEALLDEYMDQGSIAEEHLAHAVAKRELFPCYYGSALKVEGVKELLAGFAKYHRAPEYENEFSARVYKIGRDAKGARLTYLKVTGGTLHVKDRISYDGLEEKVDQIRLYSGEKFETAEAVEAGEVCAVTGLTTTVPGQGLGAQQESSVPVLEPVLNYRIYLPDDVKEIFKSGDYTAKVASNLGFKCIMVDLAKDGALSYLYQDTFSAGEVVNVNGIDLIKGPLETGSLAGYDYVFISYEHTPLFLELCHELYFATTFQRNDIYWLKNLKVPDVARFLIVRDRAASSMSYKYILKELPNLEISEDDIYALEDTEDDIAAKIYLQHSMKTKLSRLSTSIKDLVEHLLDIDSGKKQLNAAWAALKKG